MQGFPEGISDQRSEQVDGTTSPMLEDGTHTLRIQIYPKNPLISLYSYFGDGMFRLSTLGRGLDSLGWYTVAGFSPFSIEK